MNIPILQLIKPLSKKKQLSQEIFDVLIEVIKNFEYIWLIIHKLGRRAIECFGSSIGRA